MNPSNPEYRQRIEEVFNKAAFINDIGVRLKDLGPGWCETTLEVLPRHLQQDNIVHAGVQATMADHTAGGAAGTLMREDEIVLTVEFKINLLRPCIGQNLRCRAQVLRPGKSLIVAESEVYAFDGQQEKLTAKATVTLTLLKWGEKS